MLSDIIFDETAFSVDHWARFSKEDFIKECVEQGIFRHYANQVESLEIVYDLIIIARDTP